MGGERREGREEGERGGGERRIRDKVKRLEGYEG